MSERQSRSPSTASVHIPGPSQQRSFTPQGSSGYGGREDYQQPAFQQFMNQPYNIPPPNQQTQPNELRAGQIQQQMLQGQQGLVPQQGNMNYQPAMRPQNPPMTQPFYRGAPGNMPRSQQFNSQMNQPQAQPSYPANMANMYIMQTGQPLGFNTGQHIILNPQMQMNQGNRMTTPQFMGLAGTNTAPPYLNQQQPVQYYNNLTVFPQSTMPQTTLNQPPPPPQKRERHILKIEDPVTHKDIMMEVLKQNQSESSRSTPPSGASSGSRNTPSESPAPQQPVSNVAAEFAAQVAETLKGSKTHPPSQSTTLTTAATPHQSIPQTAPPVETEPPQPSGGDIGQPSQEEQVTDPVPPISISQPAEEVESTRVQEASRQVQSSEEENLESSQQDTVDSSVPEVSNPASLSSQKVLSDVAKPEEKSAEVSDSVSESLSSNVCEYVSEDTKTDVQIKPASETPEEEPKIVGQVSTPESESQTQQDSSVSVPVEKTPESLDEKTPLEKEAIPAVPVVVEAKPVKEPVEPTAEVTAKEVKKTKKKAKDFNKKELSGTDMDAFMDDSKPEKPVEPETVTVEEKQVPKVEIRIEDDVSPDAEDTDVIQENGLSEEEGSMETKPVLKYKYKEDQWSPLNPEGKRQYDREFILQLQYATESTTKPSGLPDLPEIILDKPHNVGGGSQSRSSFMNFPDMSRSAGMFDFTPGYVKGSPRPGGHGQAVTKRGSAQKGRGGGSSQRVIQHTIGSLQQDIQLHKADSAWKPARKTDVAKDEDEKKTEELYKKARGILNKLTPQKFQTLVKQMAELEIDTEKRLKSVTDLVFEKAISEPGFSVAYASMCRYLTSIKVPSQTKEGEYVNFRAILLTKCQKEFEKDKDSEEELEKKRKVISELKGDEKAKEEELKAELEFAETKARRRSLGNIRFIGELFKLKMLTENIMHDCLFKLLRAKDEESLECLCRLLSTIGKELDSEKAKPRMDQYFNQMDKIVSEKKTSSRVRFMLQDVIELRLNKWIPRRDENNPKTLDQIHKEAQKEEQERQIFLQQAQQQQQKVQGGRGGGGGPRGSRGPPMSGSVGSNEGWNTVGKANIRADRQSIDPSKLKFSRQNVDESSIQLGPGGGASRFAGWGRGSTGGGARNSQESQKSTPSNRFSAFSEINKAEDESRSRFGVSPARGDSRGRGFGKPPGSRGITPRSSIEQEREKALAAVRDIASSQNAPRQGLSRDSSRESRRPEREPERAPPTTTVKQLTEDEMEKKTKAIMDEYLHVHDIKEAILCVEELNSPSTIHVFVGTALNHVLERSEVARSQTGHLLHDLVKKGTISVDVYVKGLLEILQYAEDMEIDIPKIWQYFGELIGPMIQDGSVPLSFLRQAAQPLKENNKAGNLVAEVLHAASHREGHKKVGNLWRQSSLQWEEFVPVDQKQQFLRDKKLEFTEGEGSQPSTPTISRSIESIQETLDDLLINKNADNETVFDWIEENCDDKTMRSKQFIRALMTSVCQSAIRGTHTNLHVVPDEIKRRGVVLTKFLGNQAEYELQALYALQALVHKLEHPSGVLRILFDTLYDEDIISEDAFNQWEKSSDPAEQEGKGVALKSVVQFFTWLREAEDVSDS